MTSLQGSHSGRTWRIWLYPIQTRAVASSLVLNGCTHVSASFICSLVIPGSPIRGRMWGGGKECLSISVAISLVPTDMATGQPDPDNLSLKILCQVILDVSSWQLRRITVLWHIFPYWYNYCSSDSYLKYDLYINKYFGIFWSFMKFNIWVCF